MIHYEVNSTIRGLDSRTTEGCYWVFSASGSTGVLPTEVTDARNTENNLPAVTQCAKLRRNDKYWLYENSTCNNYFAVSSRYSPPDTRDEVKSTKDLIYSCEFSGHGRIASFYAVYFVEQCFRTRAYDQVNRILAEVDISSMTEWSMIALLRSSFRARNFLPAWPTFLSSVRNTLQNQGKDSNRLLRGLVR